MNDKLLIDIETGRVLNAPDEPYGVTSRWVESHPFAEEFQAPTGWFIVVGPDANRVSRGFGGGDRVIYEVIDEIPETGELRLRKES